MQFAIMKVTANENGVNLNMNFVEGFYIDWSEFSYWKPVFVPNGLSEKILYSKQIQFYRHFYVRFAIILKQLKKIRTPYQLVNYIVNILRLVLNYRNFNYILKL